jgi:hypothetical protein
MLPPRPSTELLLIKDALVVGCRKPLEQSAMAGEIRQSDSATNIHRIQPQIIRAASDLENWKP